MTEKQHTPEHFHPQLPETQNGPTIYDRLRAWEGENAPNFKPPPKLQTTIEAGGLINIASKGVEEDFEVATDAQAGADANADRQFLRAGDLVELM